MDMHCVSVEQSLSAVHRSKEGNYWTEKLSGELVRSSFPPDHQSIDEKTTDETVFDFPPGVAARILKISGGSCTRLHMVLLAGVVVLLGKYTGNTDIIVGAPIYRQEMPGDMVDQLVNTILVLRHSLKAGMTFKELLLQVRNTIVAAEEHQNYPMDALLYRLNMALPETGEFPLFDVVVLLEDIHEKSYLKDISVNTLFFFYKDKKGETIGGRLECNGSCYKKASIIRMVNHFLHLMQQFMADVDLKILEAELWTGEEKKQLLFEFNDTQTAYDRENTIIGLFEEQVKKTPHHIAVKGSGLGTADMNSLSYLELNRQGNRLAGVLRRRGVGSQMIVGLMVERSVEVVVGIITILKAGGAYLPVDPDAPESVIANMLDDCQAPVLVTETHSLAKHSFTGLQNLRSGSIRPVVTRARPQIINLDILPFPDRSLVDYEKYTRHIAQAMAKNVIVMQATRGCPYNCAYCHKIWPKKHVFRSARHIYDEVKQNYDLGVRKFAFIDDIFNLNKANSMKFFELIIKHGLDVQFYFPGGFRGDILTKEFIDLAVEAGTVSFALALETASTRLQKLIRKNLDIEKFRESIQYVCLQYPGIILELYTMHGFPTETREEALMTLDFIRGLKWVHFPYMNILKIYPNTDMEKLALEHGISQQDIIRSEYSPHFELSENMPFDKNFSMEYRSEFLSYFMLKERLLKVLPLQMKVMTEDELLQKYDSYLPTDKKINTFDELLDQLKLTRKELSVENCAAPEEKWDFEVKMKEKNRYLYPGREASEDALRLLLLDLSQFFSQDKAASFFYDVVGEAPLGLMYLLTYLNREHGSKINGKIAKSRTDFDSYHQLKALLEDFKPDVIGVRSLHIYQDFFHRTLSIIRQWGIDVPIISGGPYSTTDYVRVLQDRNVDLVVLGEGEVTFNELIEKMIENKGQLPEPGVLKDIPGLAFIPRQKKSLMKFAREIIMMDGIVRDLPGERPGDPPRMNSPEDPCYVIFTSGSTGKSKGVILEHRNVNHLFTGLKKRVYEAYGDQFLHVGLVAPYVFDASVKQIFLALLQGHCLHVVPEETRRDGTALMEFLARCCIDVSDGTPTHLEMLAQSLIEPGRLPAIKHFLIGGEPLRRQTIEKFWWKFGKNETDHPRITNVYGPTECCVDTTAYEVTGDSCEENESIPVGKPLPNVQVFIRGREDQLQPVGVPGELCISGDGTARGYLNSPELTAEKFAPYLWDYYDYPDGYYRSHILYRTGDRARWLPEGNIEFLGRFDRQVKIRGYRIEMEEIEHVLSACPVVKEAVVTVNGDSTADTGEKYLCAYIVPAAPGVDTGESLVEIIRKHLCQRLPEYLIPGYFVPMERLPLTPNGKINRRDLPQPEINAGINYVEPGNEIEEILVGMCSEILGIEKKAISMHANFFEIGGHSLKATILIARIHRRFEVKLPLAKIFENPTIRGIASLIINTEKIAFVDLEKAEKKEFYPLSYHQERLWYIQQAEPETTAFTLVGRINLDHEVDPMIIKKTLDTLMTRHESFRTYFRTLAEVPVQLIADKVEVPLQIIDLSSGEEEEKEQTCEQIYDKEARTPSDITNVPIFRCLLVKMDNQRFVLMFSMNHINTDGWSMEIVRNEFSLLYEAYRAGKEINLGPLEWQYKDFSQWQHRQMSHPVMKEKSHRFWKEKLETGVSPLVIPGDFKSGRADRTGAYWQFMIHNELKEKLKRLADATGTTLFMVMFSTYILLLSRFSHQEDIACAIIHSGRSHSAMHSIMGFFVNSILFKTRVEVEENFGDILQRVSKDTLAVFQHQNYPIERVCDELKMKYPDISVCINMLHIMEQARRETLESYEPYLMDDERDDAKFDIETYFIEFQNGINVRWMYKKNVYKPETMRYMIDEYIKILDYFGENPDKSYRDYRQEDNQESIW